MINQLVSDDVRRSVVLAAIEDPAALLFPQLLDLVQKRNAFGSVRTDEKMDLHRAASVDFTPLERLDPVVPKKFQQLEAFVESHFFL